MTLAQAVMDGLVPMPVKYSGGYIALSYIVSATGSTTCLELLHRRSSRSGLFNWYLLLTSSLAMGGIGIWSMHFIGNRAILLGDGSDAEQISYNIPFTIVSLILPIIVVSTAFYAISFEEKPGIVRLLTGGFLTGAAVCAMHYIGQLGISNYHCSYAVGNVVGAALIATVAATVALSVFFRWKAAWTNSWWRRMLCAALLAVAVSGMHWTAAVGTSYRRIPGASSLGQLSRTQTVIVCAALSFSACFILSICAIIAGGNRRRSTTRARQLVLSCAFFDSSGRIMVSPQVFLPTRKVVDRYINRSMKDDDFSRIHPAFLWAFRASRHWNLIKGIVPSMKGTVQNNETQIKRLINQRGVVTDTEHDTEFSFETVFKHFFCISAQGLADELRQPLAGLGELYHEVLSTVTQVSRFELGSGSIPRIGKGQLMFTVRQLDDHEVSRFMANGFRFAPIERVTEVLSRRLHIPSTELSVHLHEMRDYAGSERGYTPGVHLVTFAMRPTVQEHFEVLTKIGRELTLPGSTLPISTLSKSDLDLLDSMDECSLTTCLKQLVNMRGTIGNDGSVSSFDSLATATADESFPTHLYRAMLELMATLPESIASSVRFSSKPLLAPCHRQSPSDPEQCILICFRVVSTLDTRISDPSLSFTPLRLFRVQEQVNDKIAERERFVRELNAEFASYSVQSTANQKDNEISAKATEECGFFQNKIWNRFKADRGRRAQAHIHSQPAVSQESLVHTRQQQLQQLPISTTSPPATAKKSSFNPFLREILVSKEVTVDVARLDDVELTDVSKKRTPSVHTAASLPTTEPNAGGDDYQVEGHVTYSTAALAGTERKTVIEGGLARFGTTYVDDLYGLCMGREVRMKPGLGF